MRYGSNIDWKALQEESLRRAIQAREEERQRQIFEAVYHPSTNRNAAGGAAAASGGDPNANQNASQTTQSSIFVYKSTDAFNYYFFVANYNTITTTTPTSLGVDYTIFNVNTIYVVNEGGYVIDFTEQSDSNHHIIKVIDSGGNVLDTLDITTSDIFIDSVTTGWIFIADSDDSIYWWFDGNNLYKVPQSYFEGLLFWNPGGLSGGTRANNLGLGFFAVYLEDVNYVVNFYILDKAGNINLIYSNSGEIEVDPLNLPFLNLESDYIFVLNSLSPEEGPFLAIKALDINGNEIDSLDLTEEYDSLDDSGEFGTGKHFFIFENSNDLGQELNLVIFNGTNFQSSLIGPQRLTKWSITRSKWLDSGGSTITWTNTIKNENAFFVKADGSSSGNLFEVTDGQIISYINEDFYFYDISGKKIEINQDYQTLSDTSAYFIIDDGDGLISVLTSGPDVDDPSKFYLLSTGVTYSGSLSTETYGPFLYMNAIQSEGGGGTAFLIEDGGDIISTLEYPNEINSFRSASNVIELNLNDDKESYYAIEKNGGFLPKDFIRSTESITPYYTEENRRPSVLIRDGWYDGPYWFNDVGSTYSIGEGGNDMYDGGNIIETNYANPIPYTHVRMNDSTPFIDSYQATDISQFPMQSTIITGASAEECFGPSASYFTNMYPGMFFLAVHETDITTFRITGGLGSDSDTIYGPTGEYETVQNGATYSVYYKCTSDLGSDPSVNHIIITNTGLDSSTRVLPPPGEDSDLDEINDLTSDPDRRIYYMLLSKAGGNCLTVEEIEDASSAFLELINPTGVSGAEASPIDYILETINESYESITSILGEHTNQRRVQILTTSGVNYGSVIYNEDFIQGNNFMIGREINPQTSLATYRIYDFNFNFLYSFSEEWYTFNYSDDIVGERAMIRVSNKDFDNIYPNRIYLITKSGYTTVDVDIFDNASWSLFNDIVWWID